MPQIARRTVAVLATLFALAASACSDAGPNAPDGPATLAIVAGDAQSAPVASAIPQPITLRVLDGKSRGVPNVSIQLAITSGDGELSATTANTDGSGTALIIWTLGPTAGPQTVTARVASTPNITALIHATATPAIPASLKVLGTLASTIRNGDQIDSSMRVAVVDRFGNTSPRAGVAITASLAGGGKRELRGTTSAVTDATGVAAFPQLAIVGDTGASSLMFAAASLTAASLPLRIITGAAARLNALPSTSIHGIVAQPGPALSVRATDLSGNPVAGIVVTFAFASINANTQVTTNADGVATFNQWTMPSKSGVYHATASSASVPDVVFDVTANAGPPASLMLLSDGALSGDAGSDGPPIRVAALDAAGNPVVGTTVTFSYTDGAKLRDVQTDSAGIARLTAWKVPSLAMTYTMTATTANGVTSQLIGLTAKIGPPSRIVLLAPVSAMVSDTAPVVARVTDLAGNPVTLARVTWTITAGAAAILSSTSTSDPSGIVRTTLLMGAVSGVIRFRGVIAQTSLATDLTASSLPGAFYALLPLNIDLSLPVNTAFTSTVRATDLWNNGIPGITLRPRSFGIDRTALPTGPMSPSSAVTDSNGNASFSAVTAPQPGWQSWLIDGPTYSVWVRVRASASRGLIAAWSGTPDAAGFTWKVGSAVPFLNYAVTRATGFPAGNTLMTFTLAPGNGVFDGGTAGGVFTPTFVSALTTVDQGLVGIKWHPPEVVGTYTMTIQASSPSDAIDPLVVTVKVVP